MSRLGMSGSAGFGFFVGLADVFLGERGIERDRSIRTLAKCVSTVLRISSDDSRIEHDGISPAVSVHKPPFTFAGRVERQETACAQESIDRFDRGNKREAEDVVAEC